jgi:hypothetical protein
MTKGEAIHRARVILYVAPVFLALTALQLWTGKSILHGGSVITRRSWPKTFWMNATLTTLLALTCLFLAARRLL